jgi:hypothetical protein
MSITVDTIATNRYAPEGAQEINLYSTGLEGGSNLTLGQLVMAVCIRAAATYESQSVTKMNTMTAGSIKLDDAADWLEKIASGSFKTGDEDSIEVLKFLTETMGIAQSELPCGASFVDGSAPKYFLEVDTYDKRMQAASVLKNKMEALARTQQQDMIDLQTMVNRRDVAYSTSSNVVKAMGTSMTGEANNF